MLKNNSGGQYPNPESVLGGQQTWYEKDYMQATGL